MNGIGRRKGKGKGGGSYGQGRKDGERVMGERERGTEGMGG